MHEASVGGNYARLASCLQENVLQLHDHEASLKSFTKIRQQLERAQAYSAPFMSIAMLKKSHEVIGKSQQLWLAAHAEHNHRHAHLQRGTVPLLAEDGARGKVCDERIPRSFQLLGALALQGQDDACAICAAFHLHACPL